MDPKRWYDDFGIITGETPMEGNRHYGKSEQETKRKRLLFFQTGMQKYKLTLEAEMQLSSLNAKTKTETYLQWQVNDFSDDMAHIDCLTYDKTMTECSNTGFKEMFAVTSRFEKLYDELNVIVDYDSGTVLNIRNMARLQEKWLQIKKEAVSYFNDTTDMESFFGLNDETMHDENFWKKMLNEQEWLYLFIALPGYGRKFNSGRLLRRDNAFRSNSIDWDLQYRTDKDTTAVIHTRISGRFRPGHNWCMKAYSKMPFFLDLGFQPDFKLLGEYYIDAHSGFIRSAEIYVQEYMSRDMLFHKQKYTITQI